MDATLRVILGMDNSSKLIFDQGRTASSPAQINAEFTRITTVPLLCSSLHQYSGQLMKILQKKGESARRITAVMSTLPQDVNVMKDEELEVMDLGIYKVIHEGAEPDDSLEDVDIIIERCTVLQDFPDVASGCAVLFGLIYCLNLSYPKPLRYTFEFFQKVLMVLEDKKLSSPEEETLPKEDAMTFPEEKSVPC